MYQKRMWFSTSEEEFSGALIQNIDIKLILCVYTQIFNLKIILDHCFNVIYFIQIIKIMSS